MKPRRISQRIDAVFQPVISLQTGAVHGYEALGRVVGRDGTPRSIPALLSRAHREGWLLPLDRALRRRALERIAERGLVGDVRYYLNVDSRCVDEPEFNAGFTRRTMDELGLGAARIVIELGERDPSLDLVRLRRLYPNYARQGFEIALDDFGAGHATLGRLLELRPDVLKLDRALVRGLAHDAMRRMLVVALTSFAHDVGIALVAEGIETAADLRTLRDIGVPLGQGYLLGRPAPLPASSTFSALAPSVAQLPVA